jgi:hypothetical protein
MGMRTLNDQSGKAISRETGEPEEEANDVEQQKSKTEEKKAIGKHKLTAEGNRCNRKLK